AGATAAVPPAPTGLSASAVSSSQIQLAWTPGDTSNTTGFKVERSTDGVNFTPVATVDAATTSYTDTGLSAGTTYIYRVRAYNDAGNSGYSNTASASTPLTAPPAPTGLTASALSSSQIRLTWTAGSTTNTTGFKIERSTDG